MVNGYPTYEENMNTWRAMFDDMNQKWYFLDTFGNLNSMKSEETTTQNYPETNSVWTIDETIYNDVQITCVRKNFIFLFFFVLI